MTVRVLSTSSSIATNVGEAFGMSVASSNGAGAVRQDEGRGRKIHRESVDITMKDLKSEQPAGEQIGTSRKRRRSKKGVEKKFDCTAKDCSKSYSRAEHLYRHQLNRKFECHVYKRDQQTD